MHRRILALALAGATVAASAQILGAPPGTPEQRSLPDTPEWKELDAPPPPALRTSGLIAIDVPGTSLHFGVDPASITVGKDRIVRYVVVATSNSGAVNGMYEGIRCDAGEVKVYARHNPDSGWVPVPDIIGKVRVNGFPSASCPLCTSNAPRPLPTVAAVTGPSA